MKFLLVLVVLSLALLAAAESTIIARCPTVCTDLWNPVCAENARCTALFGNPCKYDRWNCNTIGKEQYIPVTAQKCRALQLDSYNSIRCR
ncbi:vasotab-TY1 [Episyrphus balteatus]|uniref:vasotab-TY1 n=1 Tax=Episyrphus balteatus TaxID=286459 RepID=UPI0024869983|nr:vasotab-TY1 [Episyrphus balteatus]